MNKDGQEKRLPAKGRIIKRRNKDFGKKEKANDTSGNGNG